MIRGQWTLIFGLLIQVSACGSASGAEEPKKEERRVVMGTCLTPNGSLVRREGPGKAWSVVKEKEEIYSGDLILAVPLAGLELKKGVRLGLIADMDGRSPFPIIETAVVLHDNAEADLDFTLDRGRVDVVNRKDKGAAKITARFGEEIWYLTLPEPGSRVALEIYGRWPKGSVFTTKPKPEDVPTLDLVLLVLNGSAKLEAGCHHYLLTAPPGQAFLQWDSITGCDARPQRLDQLPPWAKPEDFISTPKGLKKRERIDRFRRLAREKSLDAAIDEFLDSNDPDQRQFAVFAMAALDEMMHLTGALVHAKHPDVWENGVIALRHWLGRGPGQDVKLHDYLIKERGFSPAQAGITLQLARSFSDHDLACPECYELLIDYLKHEKMAIRGLASWHLQRLAPAGRVIQFNPAGPKEEWERAHKEWKKLIPDGQMPPKVEKNAEGK